MEYRRLLVPVFPVMGEGRESRSIFIAGIEIRCFLIIRAMASEDISFMRAAQRKCSFTVDQGRLP